MGNPSVQRVSNRVCPGWTRPIVFCHCEGTEDRRVVATDDACEMSVSNPVEVEHVVRFYCRISFFLYKFLLNFDLISFEVFLKGNMETNQSPRGYIRSIWILLLFLPVFLQNHLKDLGRAEKSFKYPRKPISAHLFGCSKMVCTRHVHQ